MPSKNARRGLVPLPEVAFALGVRWDVAQTLLFRHELKGEKIGARWFVTRQSLEQLLERRALDAAARPEAEPELR